MQSLLRWSIENSQPGQGGEVSSQQQAQPRQFDPELIDAILGRPDSELMKEALEKVTNEQSSEDTKLQALDDFEMVHPSFIFQSRYSLTCGCSSSSSK